jgi:hypothetical protein
MGKGEGDERSEFEIREHLDGGTVGADVEAIDFGI